MNIGITFDLQTDPADELQAEFDPPGTIAALEQALAELGHATLRLGDAQALLAGPERLEGLDLVYNLAEGRGGRCREAWVPAWLEARGVPYVGSDALAQAISLDKACCKQLARGSGVATPDWMTMAHERELEQVEQLAFPVIAKPRYGGSGQGIGPEAVAQNARDAIAAVRRVWARWNQPCLIERFIPFGELTVLLIGNAPPAALPAVQRPLDARTRLAWHVARASGEPAHPVELTPALEGAAQDAARRIFGVLGCRDLARADFRVDGAGELWFLEINALPSLDPGGSLGLLAEYLQESYASLIGRIVDAALARLGRGALGGRHA